jgi:hypothetical protein
MVANCKWGAEEEQQPAAARGCKATINQQSGSRQTIHSVMSADVLEGRKSA